MTEFSDAELEAIVRQGVERGELAIERQLLDAAGPAIDALEANGDGRLPLAGPDADEPVDPTR